MRISINRLLTSHGRKRSGGRPALQLPRPTFPRGSSVYPPHSRPRTAEAGNSRLGSVFTHPKRSGVHPSLPLPRASNPCGSSVYPPHFRPRTTEATTVISPSFRPKMTDFIVISAEKRRIPAIRQLRLSIRMAARSPAAAAAESSLAPSSSFFSTPRPSRRQRPRSRIASTLPRPIALRNQ